MRMENDQENKSENRQHYKEELDDQRPGSTQDENIKVDQQQKSMGNDSENTNRKEQENLTADVEMQEIIKSNKHQNEQRGNVKDSNHQQRNISVQAEVYENRADKNKQHENMGDDIEKQKTKATESQGQETRKGENEQHQNVGNEIEHQENTREEIQQQETTSEESEEYQNTVDEVEPQEVIWDDIELRPNTRNESEQYESTSLITWTTEMNQIVLCAVANLLQVVAGMSFVFLVSFLVKMTAEATDGDFKRSMTCLLPDKDLDDECLLSSLFIYTLHAEGLFSVAIGILVDVCGRRSGMIASSLATVMGWTCILFVPQAGLMGVILTWVGMRTAMVPTLVYNAELAGSRWRGVMLCTSLASYYLGTILGFLFECMIKDQHVLVGLILVQFPVITGSLAFSMLPESPAWLVINSRTDDATKALKRIHCSTPDNVQAHLQRLQAAHTRREPVNSFSQVLAHPVQAATQLATSWPLLIAIIFVIFQKLIGSDFLYHFVKRDVNKLLAVSPYWVIHFTHFLFILVAGLLVRLLGKRLLILVSGVGMMCLMFLYGAIDLYHDWLEINSPTGWNSVFKMAILFFLAGFNTFGYYVLPQCTMVEIFMTPFRGSGAGLTMLFANGMHHLTLWLYQCFVYQVPRGVLFILFSFLATSGAIIVFVFLPETEGKDLETVEQQFDARVPEEPGIELEEMGAVRSQAGASTWYDHPQPSTSGVSEDEVFIPGVIPELPPLLPHRRRTVQVVDDLDDTL